MFWIQEYTDRIRTLLKAGDTASLTYAALEARLALERVCYDRLRLAHRYISANDLRRWTPRYVVQDLMMMVDSKISSEWTLSMGSVPGDNPPEYVEIGTQKGFDPKRINVLWQALSNFLHSEFPKSSDHPMSHYKPADAARAKIAEALDELDRLAEGTAIAALVFESVSFRCVCGHTNARAAQMLSHNDIINCMDEGCKEQYRVEKINDDVNFERRTVSIDCHNCGTPILLPFRPVAEMPRNQVGRVDCRACGRENNFIWKLAHVKRASEIAEP